MVTIQNYFNDVFSYAFGVEKWVKNYFKEVGYEPKYTFVSDFAMADWYGKKSDVLETYKRVKESWLGNYKAFTEVVMSINLLSWANAALIKQGISGRDEWIATYNKLYERATKDFYKEWGKNVEACDYFFETTD